MTAPIWITLALTLKVALWATAINMILGVAVAWSLARHRFVGRETVSAVLTLPLVLPPTVVGYYLLVVIGRRGWLGAWLSDTFGINLIFTWQGAVLAATVVAFPLVLTSARSAFEAVDPQLERAARVLGLGEWAVFFRVTLPMAWPGILAIASDQPVPPAHPAAGGALPWLDLHDTEAVAAFVLHHAKPL